MSIFKNLGFLSKLTYRNIKAYGKKASDCVTCELTENSLQCLGHATNLINLNGKLIITDPILTFSIGHFKRLIKLPIKIKDFHIDYILLSHGHMDHMHFPSLLKINKDATVIVPPGYNKLLRILGFKNVITLKPKEEFKDNYISISAFKANHDGRRYYLGNNDLSNSYLIKSNDKKVFFAGDTAYTKEYKAIESDIALMPVGCYKPDRFKEMHCSPEESFDMFKMMNSKKMIPIHYKTFIISLDNSCDTLSTLNNINDGSIHIVEIGQTITF